MGPGQPWLEPPYSSRYKEFRRWPDGTSAGTTLVRLREFGMRGEEHALRQAIIEKCRWMNASGLNQGTSGNISARYRDRMLITPSGIPYDTLKPAMIAAMPLDGDGSDWRGPLQPSSEWRFHFDIMRARPE